MSMAGGSGETERECNCRHQRHPHGGHHVGAADHFHGGHSPAAKRGQR